MSGFPVPAKAKAAAHKAIVDEVEDHLRWNVMAYGKAWTEEGEDTTFIVAKSAEKALAASLPVLAADPDAKRRVREAIHGYACGCERPWPFDPRYDAMVDAVMAALFGVASPSTPKETMPDA